MARFFFVEEEIEEEMRKFNNLIDKETAKLLILEKKHQIKRMKIKEIKSGSIALYAKIMDFVEKQKDRASLIIGDETGYCILKLWHHNVKIANFLKIGDVIKVANGWAKESYYGIEINVGKFGMIEKVNKDICPEYGIKDGLFCLMGKLRKVFPTEIYFENGKEKFVKKILVDENEIYFVDEKIREMKKFCEGDKIVIFWLYKKGDKIYTTNFSRVKHLFSNHIL